MSDGAWPLRARRSLPVAAALGGVCSLLLACATPTGDDHTTQAALGRVTEVAAASATPSEPRAHAGIGLGVGSGGAVGGISLGMVFGADRGSDLPVVVLTLADGQRRLLRSKAEVRVGDCVAVMTRPDRVQQAAWQPGEATLVPAEGCP